MRGISILIAELIATLLEKDGYNVSKVSDGQEAVRAVETQSFALLILDMKLQNKSFQLMSMRKNILFPIIRFLKD